MTKFASRSTTRKRLTAVARRTTSPGSELHRKAMGDLKNRINAAVDAVSPVRLAAALGEPTCHAHEPDYDEDESSRVLSKIVLPSKNKWNTRRSDLIQCLNLLLSDHRFTHPIDLMLDVIQDGRQLVEIMQLLLTREDLPPILYDMYVYVAIKASNPRIVSLLIGHHQCNINKAAWYYAGAIRPLHYAINQNSPCNSLLSVLLKESDVDPNMRSRNNELHWATSIDCADNTYMTAAQGVDKKRAANHIRLLLACESIQIHTIQESQTVSKMEYGDDEMFNV